MAAIPLPPHGHANMKSTFMTTHDKEYTGPDAKSTLVSQDSGESGHTSNRVLFARTHHLSSNTTYGGHYRPPNRRLTDDELSAACLESLKPQEKATAFVRIASKVGFGHGDASTISTMKASYTNSGPVSTCRPAHYSGDAITQFNRTLLHIPSPAEDQRGRHRSKSASTFVPRDSSVPTANRRELLHTAMLPNTYFLHSRLIGDKTLAKPGQLPTPLISASEFENAMARGEDPRLLLHSVAGTRPPPMPATYQRFETNPITMSPKEQSDCRVTRRVELQGHVGGTTYHAHFVDQKFLPEIHEPFVGLQKPEDRPVLLPEVAPRPQQMVTLTQPNGSLLAERPAGVHPAVWKRLKAVEYALSVDKHGDPHAHKTRQVTVR
mmetsp:Transcript_58705/g.67802  ORF Transcript_58705/g.67802 Transcript_58705/m.67802 type:complete len:379 (-) Transcript_58705:103-1239(-)